MTGIIRLLILGLLVWLAWKLVRRLISPPAGKQPPARGNGSTRMLRCEQCGVHVPEPDAFIARGHAFCSQAHQQQWLEEHDQ